MKYINKFLFSFTVQFLFSSLIFCQSFEISTLVDIPGNNIELEVLSADFQEITGETYITWINKIDSVYSVYLKQIAPIVGENLVIASDESIKSKPQISINRYQQGIKIAWQSFTNNIWKVYLKYFYNNQLSDSLVLVDSVNNDPQISLSIHRIAWIDNGDLFIKEFYPVLSEKILFDSLICASPDLYMSDLLNSTKVVYEKNFPDSIKINLTEYYRNGNFPPVFTNNILSKGLHSRFPNFGLNEGIAFQTFENGIWKAEYSVYDWMNPTKTTNSVCNYVNPIVFSYPIPISFLHYTPFFVVFDSDTLADNNEIFINALLNYMNGEADTLINISQNPGNDFKPKVTFLSAIDSMMYAIMWLHTENNKTDIWIAKDKFNPIPGAVDNERKNEFGFVLSQNYPNPFNPTTIIKYEILKTGFVSLKVFDVLGNEIAILVNEEQSAGNHHIEFNSPNLASGVYYYQFRFEEFVDSKKMVIIK